MRGIYDPGIAASRRLASLIFGSSRDQPARYEAVSLEADGSKEMEFLVGTEDEDQGSSSRQSDSVSGGDQAEDKTLSFLPTRRIFTKAMLLVLFALILQDIQIGVSSDAMFNLFSFPVASKEQESQMVLPFRFAGGAGFKPSSLAWTTCIFGEYLYDSAPAETIYLSTCAHTRVSSQVSRGFLSSYWYILGLLSALGY